ncbi:hypothetical protein FRX31_016957, partial [Thalictrum thalictroides]
MSYSFNFTITHRALSISNLYVFLYNTIDAFPANRIDLGEALDFQIFKFILALAGRSVTHEISLDDTIEAETTLDIFKPDPQFLDNEMRYEELVKNILGDDSVQDAASS